MKPEISIVTAYHNRLPQFIRTLSVLELCPFENFEVVVVDDASDEEHRLENYVSNFSFDINLIRIPPESKTHCNPCVPFNIGFSHARADKIIIQNPECVYVNDLFARVLTLEKNDYQVFRCFAVSVEETNSILSFSGSFEEHNELLNNIISSGNEKGLPHEGGRLDSHWFHHEKFRPVWYHFASAISRSDLVDLGGFDERYAMGINFDDDEFLYRIHSKNMNILANPETVIHLWHPPGSGYPADAQLRSAINRQIYEEVTKKLDSPHVKTRLNS
tara:strand:+ start:11787 stop:12608 length:822 start_codon:yes stop_codon:yes gene_type:complete